MSVALSSDLIDHRPGPGLGAADRIDSVCPSRNAVPVAERGECGTGEACVPLAPSLRVGVKMRGPLAVVG